jgi:beta-lactamase regulating signal transducer with metallopeptidase domain
MDDGTNLDNGAGTIVRAVNGEVNQPTGAGAFPWPRRLTEILGLLWLAGAIVALLRLVVGHVRWRRGRELRPAPPMFHALVSQVASDLGIRPPSLAVDRGLATPVVCGLLRPRLLWPAHLLDGLPEERARTLVAHELAHVRRGDLWLGILEVVGSAVWWWYPGWRLVQRGLRDAAERACDASVVACYPALRRAYAEGLLDVAGSGAPPRSVLALGLEGPGPVRRRLQAILSGEAGRGRRSGAPVALLLVALLLPAWRAAPGTADAADGQEVQQVIVTALARAAMDPVAGVRRVAANALRDIGGGHAEAVLRGMVEDADPDVRHAARSALGMEPARPNMALPQPPRAPDPRPGQAELDAVIARLLDADAGIRLEAARRFGNLRDARAVPALVAALGDADFRVRQAAADALGNVGDPAAASALVALLDDAHPRVRQSAAAAIGPTGGTTQVPALAAALEDPDEHVRSAAASALGRIGSRRAP